MNNNGFQLSINMLVVIVLGIAMLGIGMSLFNSAFNKTMTIKDTVDSQTQNKINALLDDGSIVVLPRTSDDGERGKLSEFSLGITSIYHEPKNFSVHITYAGSSAFPNGICAETGCDPFQPFDFMSTGSFSNYCTSTDKATTENCGNSWVLLADDNFELSPNERKAVPFGINVPRSKKIKSGQYIFNVDICVGNNDGSCIPLPVGCVETKTCHISDSSRYDARYQVIVNI